MCARTNSDDSHECAVEEKAPLEVKSSAGDRKMNIVVNVHCPCGRNSDITMQVTDYTLTPTAPNAWQLPREMQTKLMLSITGVREKLLGVKWYHHVRDHDVRRTTKQLNLSQFKHSISPFRPHCTNVRYEG